MTEFDTDNSLYGRTRSSMTASARRRDSPAVPRVSRPGAAWPSSSRPGQIP